MNRPSAKHLPQIGKILHDHFGPLHWWPADNSFEVVVGAILTQNTAWANVEKTIYNLKKAEALSLERLASLPLYQLEKLIKPSGFFRQKATRLQHLAKHLVNDWQSNLNRFCSGSLDDARARLLNQPGIGPETADAILLYAAARPSFIVDAYTRRIFERVGLLTGKERYDAIRLMFMQNLPHDAQLFNEYHAQIVQLGKDCCRKSKPLCFDCPLKHICLHAQTLEA